MKKMKEVVLTHVEVHRIQRFDHRALRMLYGGLMLIVIGIVALIWLSRHEEPITREHLTCAIIVMVLGAGFTVCAPGLMKHHAWARLVGLLLYFGMAALTGYLLVGYVKLLVRGVPKWAGEIAGGIGNASFAELFGGVGKLLAGAIVLLFMAWFLLRQLRGFRWLHSREAHKICARHTAPLVREEQR